MFPILLSTTTTMLIVWSVFIVVSAIIELETQELITIWFTLGAIVALVACALKADITVQFILFLTVSAIAIFYTRPLAKKIQEKEIIKTNADRIIGTVVIVTKAINKETIGEVVAGDRYWRAVPMNNESFVIGDKVLVHAISGTKLIVSSINQSEEITL